MAITHDRAEGGSASFTSNKDIEMRDENEKLARLDHSSHSEESERTKVPEEMEMGDERENAGLLPAESTEKVESKRPAWFGTVLWTAINTLATIGIVSSTRPVLVSVTLLFRLANAYLFLGLHQQSHLLRPVPQARATDVCRVPFHRHMVHALHPVAPPVRFLPTPPRCHH